MNSQERTELLADFMRHIAPEVAKYILAYHDSKEIEFAPEKIVGLTAQIASGLVERCIELSDAETPQTAPRKIAFAEDKRAAAKFKSPPDTAA